MAEKKEDRRVRKTKKQLKAALTKFLQEKPIQEIRVQELADYVDINRGTFYQHYRDIYDLLYSMEEDVFKNFESFLNEASTSSNLENSLPQFLFKLFTSVKEDSELIKALLGEYGDHAFINRLKRLVKEKGLDQYVKQYKNFDPVKFEYVYSYTTAGFVELLHSWLESGMKESPEEMTNLCESIVFGIFEKYIS